jgi:hypothetical protein
LPTPVADAIDGWWKALDPDPRITILDSRHATIDSFTMREYLATDLLDDRYLDS